MTIPDPFRWLEDAGSAATASWLDWHEASYESRATGWQRDSWRAAVSHLDAADVVLRPSPRGKRLFFRVQHADAEQPLLLLREDGRDRVLFDPLTFDESGASILEKWDVSPDGDLIACQVSERGLEDTALYIVDVESARVVDGPISRLRRSAIAWLPDGRGFYYVRRLAPELHPGEENYHRRVYHHEIGADPAGDALVYGEPDEKTAFYSLDLSADGRTLAVTVTIGSSRSTRIWLADVTGPAARAPEFRALTDADDVRSEVCFPTLRRSSGLAGNALWLLTDAKAPRGRIVEVRADGGAGSEAASADWREVVPERQDAVLEDVAALDSPDPARHLLLVLWKRHAVAEMTVHDADTGTLVHVVDLPGQGAVGPMVTGPEGGTEAWFAFTSFTQPMRVLRYDAASGAVDAPLTVQETSAVSVPVESRLVPFASADGTTVRMFVLSATGAPDRPRPTILTGYGGFGVSMEPCFQPHALAWVLAGGVYAIACLRGGAEEGEDWHRAGMRGLKTNVFADFEAAAATLVRQGWTSPDRLAVTGGSNGGLLVAAALTRFPERFAAVVCSDALLDMARFDRFGLGPSWVPEYGSPAEPEQLEALLSYSPYHNVHDGRSYPPVLFTAGVTDTRVDPLHTRKMLARLEQAGSGTGPFLLRLEHDVGHGARSRSQFVNLLGDQLAFLGDVLGLPAPEPEPDV